MDCNLHVHGGASSFAAPDRSFGVLHGLLRPAWGVAGGRDIDDDTSFHLWSCGRFGVTVGILAGMCWLLAGFQNRRRRVAPARALACSLCSSPTRTGASLY
jgi:hypothetical protein